MDDGSRLFKLGTDEQPSEREGAPAAPSASAGRVPSYMRRRVCLAGYGRRSRNQGDPLAMPPPMMYSPIIRRYERKSLLLSATYWAIRVDDSAADGNTASPAALGIACAICAVESVLCVQPADRFSV